MVGYDYENGREEGYDDGFEAGEKHGKKEQRKLIKKEILKHVSCKNYHSINGKKATCLDMVIEWAEKEAKKKT